MIFDGSSPFFMAARAVVPDGSQADQFNWFCDQHRAALDFSQIGRVRQVVKNGELRSVFEVKAGLSPLAFGLPVSVSGAIVTTADIVSDVGDVYGDVAGWRLAIKSVQVENSNIPLLKEALDDWLQLPIPQITNALEATPLDVETWRPMPLFRTRYGANAYCINHWDATSVPAMGLQCCDTPDSLPSVLGTLTMRPHFVQTRCVSLVRPCASSADARRMRVLLV